MTSQTAVRAEVLHCWLQGVSNCQCRWHGGSGCWRSWHGSSFCKLTAQIAIICRPLPESRFALRLHVKHGFLRDSFASSFVSKRSFWISAPGRRGCSIVALDPTARRHTHARKRTHVLASGCMWDEAGVRAVRTDVAASRARAHVTQQLRRPRRYCWRWSTNSSVAQYILSFCLGFGLGCGLCGSFGSHGTVAEKRKHQSLETKSTQLESNGA